MPPKNKGSHGAHSGSRAMVETIAVTDGELTALSALSGQQVSSTDVEGITSSSSFEEVEETVFTSEPDITMEVVEEEESVVEETAPTLPEVKKEVSVPSSVVLTSNNIIRGTPMFVSGTSQGASASTSYVVIQSSPGNRVLTTNTTVQGKKAPQIPQIIGRVNTGSTTVPSQFQTVVRTIPASGPPPLVSRGSNITVAGIRPLNPQAVAQRGVVTKVLLPRASAGQQVVTVPVQEGKSVEPQRIFVGGQQVRFLSSGMKIATIPGNLSEVNKIRAETEKPSVIQSTGSVASNPIRPITVVQARPMGVLSPSKIQQILPSSPTGKGLLLNKVMPGSGTRVTVVPQGAKSPAKILPAPVSTVNTGAGPQINQSLSPQKVIIRQAPLKSVTNAVPLRIPTSSQPLIASPSGLQSVQVAGRQMQYVRLVSIPSSTSSTATITSSVTSKTSTVLTLASSSVGQSMQGNFKMIPVASVSSPKTVISKSVTGQKIIIPATLAMTQIKTSVPSSILSSVSLATSIDSTASTSNIVMLSTAAAQATRNNVNANDPQPMEVSEIIETPTSNTVVKTVKMTTEPILAPATVKPGLLNRSALAPEPNGIRPRKPCNCTKSQCLKLYCDCFANGEFCNQCNCNCCFNNLEHEEDRQRAIRSCLDRNPNAFRPKIGKGHVGDGRRHNKGCNCKRSGCLKNYCECFEAKIACSHNCKCIGCRNIEDDIDRRSLRELIEVADIETPLIAPPAAKKKASAQNLDIPNIKDDDHFRKGARRSSMLMCDEVVNATCQCLVAQADFAEQKNLSEEDAEKLIIEEFGRCLVEIISCVSNRTEDSGSVSEYSV